MRTAQGCLAVWSPNHQAARCCVALLVLCVLPSLAAQEPASEVDAGPPLARQIDQLLQSEIPQLAAAAESDGKLLRRLSLDLRGVVPTREELDEFASDQSADRWTKWVDRFLDDPLCDEHLVNFLDRTLMLRRGFTHVDRGAWIAYLRDHVAAETPLDKLSGELLFSPWWNQEHRAAQRFYLDRGGDPHLITRDLARVFLGRDLQCAQCHDHPLVKDFRQIDYHGLLAFVSGGSLTEVAYKDAEGKDQKVQLYIEKAAGDAPFESVFERGTMLRSGTRLTGQTENIDEYHLPDRRYLDQPPEGAMPGVANPPKVSRRERLAHRLADRDNAAFVANWANRLWALVYGKGLVHPLDMMEPDNPPSNPELFDVITDGLLRANMQVKPFLRELVTADAYRRGALPEIVRLANQTDDAAWMEARKSLEEQVATNKARVDSLEATESQTSEAYDAARTAWLTEQAARTAGRAELDTAEAAMLEAKKKHDEATGALAAAEKKLSDSQARAALLDESAAKLEQALALLGSEDAELSQAIAVAKQRAESARGQAPDLEKGVADTKSAAETAAGVLQQSTGSVEEALAKFQPIQSSLIAADQAHVEARSAWCIARSQLVAARRSLAQTQRLIQWMDRHENVDQLAESIRSTNEQIAAARAEEASLSASIEVSKTKVAAAQSELTAANQQAGQARQAIESHRGRIETLERSVAALNESAKLLSNAAPIVTAQGAIQDEITKLRTESGQLQATVDAANAKVTGASSSLAQQKAALEVEVAHREQRHQQMISLEKERDERQENLDEVRAAIEADTQSIVTDSESQLASSGLFPLSAEQMCWSTLRVTGVLDAYIRNELAELEKQTPLPPEADDAVRRQRHRQATRQAIDKLRGNADHYVSLYASGPDKTLDDYFASADQALYVANGGGVFSWAGPGNNNPTQVATTLSDAAEVANVLYWSYLCRQPSEEEIALVKEQLAAVGDQRNAIIQEMAWSLLASAEFRFTR